MLRRVLAGTEDYEMERSGEYPSWIAEAMVTGTPVSIYPNVPNRGWVDNLPEGAVVEVEAVVDSDGIHPQAYGSLPPQLASLDRRHIEFHDLAVTALLEENREAALHAMMLDPLTSAVCAPAEIRAMFEEMVEAQRDYLPDFLT